MSLRKLEIHGLRGFARLQELSFALPNSEYGSGLTILVGPNNGGKSTVIEALRAFTARQPPSFTEGRRNVRAGSRITIRATDSNGEVSGLRTVERGGSETQWFPSEATIKPFVLQSRRYFNPYFSNVYEVTRESYIADFPPPQTRGASLDSFSRRLFRVQENRAEFDAILGKVVSPVPNWMIEQSEAGQYYLKVERGDLYHSSEGLGEGLISLLFLIDALYDSTAGDLIVIDEPELSLHPTLQRRLFTVLSQYAADRQIVLATHSPYFVDFQALINGAKVARVHSENEGSVISALSELTMERLARFLGNFYNPHILGLNAREAFFLEDGVILVEGQDDVLFYQQIANQLGVEVNGAYFGWGVGGADNMGTIAALLDELGFERVVGLLDLDKTSLVPRLQEEFPKYRFYAIPANDVRTKKAQPEKRAVEGIVDEYAQVRPEFSESMATLLTRVSRDVSPVSEDDST